MSSQANIKSPKDGRDEYLVKEIFGPTVQGEGTHAGRSCVFLRFAVCNLQCTWCDTDFHPEGARKLSTSEIVAELVRIDANQSRMVVVTGGEPTLQWDNALQTALRASGFQIHMETNGTRELRAPVDWLTVSPKPQFHPKQVHLATAGTLEASECKLVVDASVNKTTLRDCEQRYHCEHWYLQPCMDDNYEQSLARTVALIKENPRWRLSIQLHKIIGLP